VNGVAEENKNLAKRPDEAFLSSKERKGGKRPRKMRAVLGKKKRVGERGQGGFKGHLLLATTGEIESLCQDL